MRSAMAAKTGTSKAAEAVLLVNSVSNTMKAATPRITTNGLAPDKKPATISPSTADAPELRMMLLKVMPPPNRNSTPQSVLSDIWRHDANLSIPMTMAAVMAIQVSGAAMPKTFLT